MFISRVMRNLRKVSLSFRHNSVRKSRKSRTLFMFKKLLRSVSSIDDMLPIAIINAEETAVRRQLEERFGSNSITEYRLDGTSRLNAGAFGRIKRIIRCRRVDTGGCRLLLIYGIGRATLINQARLSSLIDKSIRTSRFVLTNNGGKTLLHANIISRCIIIQNKKVGGHNVCFPKRAAESAYRRLKVSALDGRGIDRVTRTTVKCWIKCASTISPASRGVVEVLRCVNIFALREGDMWVSDVSLHCGAACARTPACGASALLAFAIEIAALHQIHGRKQKN